MALIVEDGTGVTGANVYAALATITAYCAALGHAAWAEATEAAQEAAALRAMAWLEGLRWKGRKYSYDNALEWPRYNVVDRNGYYVPSDEIPKGLISAFCEAARQELAEPGILQPNLTRDDAMSSLSVPGAVKIDWQDDAPKGGTTIKSLNTLLRGLIRTGNSRQVARG